MIKTFLVLMSAVLFLILSIPILLVEWILSKVNPAAKNKSSLFLVQWIFRILLFFTGVKLTVKGRENIPADKSVLYIGNHRSYFDIIIAYTLVPSLTGFISKKEIAKVPLLNSWMKNVNCLFLDRDDIKQGLQTILTACEYVKNGISIFIFPEGTRNKNDDEFLPFKGGSFKIATKSGCDIIPVSINNSDALLEAHFPKVKRANVIVEFGKPIVVSEMSRDEQKVLPETVKNTIFEMYNNNKAAV